MQAQWQGRCPEPTAPQSPLGSDIEQTHSDNEETHALLLKFSHLCQRVEFLEQNQKDDQEESYEESILECVCSWLASGYMGLLDPCTSVKRESQ